MRFTVTWAPSAQDELAAAWVQANPEERAAITLAANRIDQLLRFNPETFGESRPNNRRILFLPPLVVIFEVHDQDRLVSVLAVRRIIRH